MGARKGICCECRTSIDERVWGYSVDKFRVPLCRECQVKLKEPLSKATEESKLLYFALRLEGVPAELEKWDGYKHIDIAVTKSKLNIEVDGIQHNTSQKQTLSDLRRTYYSFKKGYFTLRIPNTLLRADDDVLDEVVYLVCEIVEISARRNKSKNKSGEQGLMGKLLRWMEG